MAPSNTDQALSPARQGRDRHRAGPLWPRPGPDELLPAALPPRWTGHALRRSYAQAAHEARKDMLETGRHGGWADGSKALAGYFNRAGI